MSDKAMSRRTSLEVLFDGVDISDSIGKYLISLSYTDSESDESDEYIMSTHDARS